MQAVTRELSLLFRALLGWFILFTCVALFLFAVGIRDIRIDGTLYPVPSFESSPLSVGIFSDLRHDLLPPEVELLSLSPFAGFATQVNTSLLAAFVLTFPVLIYRLIAYLSPALHPPERRLLFVSLVPASSLFLLGAAFAYQVVIPATFRILYTFAPALGARPYFLVDEFLSTVAFLMISIGLMFLLPVMMVFLTSLGVMPSAFWRRYARHALLGFLLFAAFITPDGSGVTMLMLAGPLALLYAGGLFAASYMERRRISRLSHPVAE